MRKCLACRKKIKNDESYQTIHGFDVCESCCETYTTVYILLNGTSNACFMKRKDLK